MGNQSRRGTLNVWPAKMVVGATVVVIGLSGCGGETAADDPPTSASPAATTAQTSATAGSDVLDFAFTDAQITSVKEGAAALNESSGSAGWFIGVWDPLRGDVEEFAPNMDPEAYFRIGGITQTMTAVTALRMVEQGTLTLAAKVSDYVPDIPNGDAINVEMLLNMTSGLADITSDETFMAAYEDDPNLTWTVADSLALLRSLPPAGEPGAVQDINSTNYIVLGEVLAAAGEKPANEVMAEQINSPASLRRTAFPTTSDMPEPAVPAVMTIAGEQRAVDLQNPNVPFTAGYAISCIDDLRSWVSQVTSGDLLTAESFAKQLPPAATTEPTYGFGLADYGGWLGHDGAMPGYDTMMLREPDSGAIVIAVATGGGLGSQTAEEVAFATIAALYPGQYPLIAEQAPTPAASPTPS